MRIRNEWQRTGQNFVQKELTERLSAFERKVLRLGELALIKIEKAIK